MNKKNFINITAEALTDDTMKANYTGNVRNFSQLISLGGALLQTYICSAVDSFLNDIINGKHKN